MNQHNPRPQVPLMPSSSQHPPPRVTTIPIPVLLIFYEHESFYNIKYQKKNSLKVRIPFIYPKPKRHNLF